MRIFVTGGTGNIGRPLCRELSSLGHLVVCLVRKRQKIDGCITLKGDLKKIDKLSNEVSNSAAIIHLACARTLARRTVAEEDILGTGMLLDSWKKGNFIFISSQSVYGVLKGSTREDAPYKPTYWYDMSKICNELQIGMEGQKGDRKAAISLRVPLYFGTGEKKYESQFLYYLYTCCLEKEAFVFESEEGLETYGSSFLGDQDSNSYIMKSLDLMASGQYNIASGYCTWKYIIEYFCKVIGKKPKYIIRKNVENEKEECRLSQCVSLLDLSRIIEATGYKPVQGIDELLENFIRMVHFRKS